MNNSDPRPMPPEVQRAYRNPLNLADLLKSNAYWPRYDSDIVVELVDALVRKHGVVDVETETGYISAVDYVYANRSDPHMCIFVLSQFDEYGGRDGVLASLAAAMQPQWARWWDTFSMSKDLSDCQNNARTMSCVLGDRQVIWLAAQCARSSLPYAEDLQDSLEMSISAAEAWAMGRASKRNVLKARSVVTIALQNYAGNAGGALSCADAVDGLLSFAEASGSAARSLSEAVVNSSDAEASVARAGIRGAAARQAAVTASSLDFRSRRADLIRSIITPTLITSASRGIR